MANSLTKAYHFSPRTGAYMSCQAELHCPYMTTEEVTEETGWRYTRRFPKWSDHHVSLQEIAEAGGGWVSTQRHPPKKVSSIVNGCFTLGSEGSGRTSVFAVDSGAQLTKGQAKAWRALPYRGKALEELSAEELRMVPEHITRDAGCESPLPGSAAA